MKILNNIQVFNKKIRNSNRKDIIKTHTTGIHQNQHFMAYQQPPQKRLFI